MVELAKEIFDSKEDYKIYYDSKFDDLMLKLNSQPSLPVSFYSDGYRNLMWLFIDLAWRASELNPTLGAKAITEAEGVVLIDEIDLHLHPQWQRKAINLLQAAFPGIQFFITTHSPIVVSSFKGPGLYKISGESVNCITSYFGKDINETAVNLMDANERDPEVQALLDRYLKLVGENKYETSESLELRKELNNYLEAGNEDLLRADLVIELDKGV